MDQRTRDILHGLEENPALPAHLRTRLPARMTVPPRDDATAWHVDPDVERAGDSTTPLDDVHALLHHDDMTVRIGPVLLPRVMAATDEELHVLVMSLSPRVRMLVAERTALPADVFELLAADDDIRVVKGIAPHPALAADRLWALAARHRPALFRKLATNPTATPTFWITWHATPLHAGHTERSQNTRTPDAPMYIPYNDGLWLQGNSDQEMLGVQAEPNELASAWDQARTVDQYCSALRKAAGK